jgi:conjugal transfer pilus assembly protein TraI
VAVDAILETQAPLIGRLQQASGLTRGVFDQLLMPVLHTLAAWVQLLPASEQHHHCGAGGLFRHSLEVAVLAGRLADGVIFASDLSPLRRKECEARWRAAVVIAGLLHDVGKPVSDVVVSDEAGDQRWQPLVESLSDWTQRNGLQQYYLHWRTGRGKAHEQQGLLLVPYLLPRPFLAWLTEPSQDMLQSILLAVACLDPESKVSRLVLEADRLSVSQDLASDRVDPREAVNQLPLYQRIVTIMRHLLLEGLWQVNVPEGRIWVLTDGVFVVWGGAAADIHSALVADAIPGVPRDEDFLADMLLDRGLAEAPPAGTENTERYWLISPELSSGETKSPMLRTLKLSDAELLFQGATPVPVAGSVIHQQESKSRREAKEGGDQEAPSPAVQPTLTGTESVPTIVPAQRPTSIDASLPEDLHWLREARGLLHQVGSQLLLEYPKDLHQWMSPSQVLARLSTLDWLEPDPALPMRKVRELGGHRGLVLTPEASLRVGRFLAAPDNAVAGNVTEVVAIAHAIPPKPPQPGLARQPTPARSSLDLNARSLLRRICRERLQQWRTLNNGIEGNEADGVWLSIDDILADPDATGRRRNALHRCLLALPSSQRSGSRIYVSEATIRALREPGVPDAT